MKKRYGIVLAIVMVLPAIAMAGEKVKEEVQINTVQRTAMGSMGSARNSRDSNQYIGCYLSGSQGGRGLCIAQNATGLSAACNFSANAGNGHLARTVSAVSDSSHIVFVWNTRSDCTDIWVRNSSRYEPRK